ncbi:MAG: hypothetical protein ACD_79C01077G0003 [uncultured bacterium]|nr:MAG: hypothetical protein ACD_79C01077G0003 [uncultured bacterium]
MRYIFLMLLFFVNVSIFSSDTDYILKDNKISIKWDDSRNWKVAFEEKTAEDYFLKMVRFKNSSDISESCIVTAKEFTASSSIKHEEDHLFDIIKSSDKDAKIGYKKFTKSLYNLLANTKDSKFSFLKNNEFSVFAITHVNEENQNESQFNFLVKISDVIFCINHSIISNRVTDDDLETIKNFILNNVTITKETKPEAKI